MCLKHHKSGTSLGSAKSVEDDRKGDVSFSCLASFVYIAGGFLSETCGKKRPSRPSDQRGEKRSPICIPAYTNTEVVVRNWSKK
jgi:hypothetical protein